jgi:AbrB family looped-hinge helix DNA binding protein
MGKVTSKLQVTLPKAIADRYGIRPGDEIEWVAAGDVIRVVPSRRRSARRAPTAQHVSRTRLFDEATSRQRAREAAIPPRRATATGRGWTRAELYGRGRAD